MKAQRSGTRLNTIWRGMKRRCHDRRSVAYPAYGGRGIFVCADWHTFVGFLDWALASDYDDTKEIDRIDTDGPYTPANCRWVSPLINRTRKELSRDGAYLADLAGKLTAEIVASAEARDRPYKLSDGHGLHLWVSPAGRKSWRYAFRLGGREKLLMIASYPRFSLWEAREAHAIARSQVKRGVDPADLKRKAKLKRKRAREGGY